MFVDKCRCTSQWRTKDFILGYKFNSDYRLVSTRLGTGRTCSPCGTIVVFAVQCIAMFLAV